MERHAHTQRTQKLIPSFSLEGMLGCERSLERPRGGGEGSIEGIPYGLEDHAAVGFNRLPEDGIVARKGRLHHLAVLLPTCGTALDIGEQKGNSAAR